MLLALELLSALIHDVLAPAIQRTASSLPLGHSPLQIARMPTSLPPRNPPGRAMGSCSRHVPTSMVHRSIPLHITTKAGSLTTECLESHEPASHAAAAPPTQRQRALSRRPHVCPHARPSRARNGPQVWGRTITCWQAHVPQASLPSYPTKPLNPVLCPPALPPSTPLVCSHLCLHPPRLCAPIHPVLIRDASAACATHGSPRRIPFLPRDASAAAAAAAPSPQGGWRWAAGPGPP